MLFPAGAVVHRATFRAGKRWVRRAVVPFTTPWTGHHLLLFGRLLFYRWLRAQPPGGVVLPAHTVKSQEAEDKTSDAEPDHKYRRHVLTPDFKLPYGSRSHGYACGRWHQHPSPATRTEIRRQRRAHLSAPDMRSRHSQPTPSGRTIPHQQ